MYFGKYMLRIKRIKIRHKNEDKTGQKENINNFSNQFMVQLVLILWKVICERYDELISVVFCALALLIVHLTPVFKWPV